MKKIGMVVLLSLFMTGFEASAAQNNQQVDYDQARSEYRAYLDKLKELSEQYREVTQQITTVMKEEGVPVFDTQSGVITTKPYGETPTQVLNARITETDRDMTASVDLPGLKRDSIRINITDRRQIHVFARKKDEPDTAKTIERIIVLPALADEEGTEASYEDGVLTVRVLKSAKKDIPVPLSWT